MTSLDREGEQAISGLMTDHHPYPVPVIHIPELTAGVVTSSRVSCDLGAQISIPDVGQVEILIPEAVAAETVVTTSSPKNRRKQMGPRSDGKQLHLCDSDTTGEVAVSDDSSNSMWSQFEFAKSYNSVELNESELSASQESFVALVPETSVDGIPPPSQSQTMKEVNKKERDRLKKRELRANPSFRQKEKEKAKLRMKNRRNDPTYRDNERTRDRDRRRASRLKNEDARARERERDRNHKRMLRSYEVGMYSLLAKKVCSVNAYSVLSNSNMEELEEMDAGDQIVDANELVDSTNIGAISAENVDTSTQYANGAAVNNMDIKVNSTPVVQAISDSRIVDVKLEETNMMVNEKDVILVGMRDPNTGIPSVHTFDQNNIENGSIRVVHSEGLDSAFQIVILKDPSAPKETCGEYDLGESRMHPSNEVMYLVDTAEHADVVKNVEIGSNHFKYAVTGVSDNGSVPKAVTVDSTVTGLSDNSSETQAVIVDKTDRCEDMFAVGDDSVPNEISLNPDVTVSHFDTS